MDRTQDHLHVHLNIYTIAHSLAVSDNQKNVRSLVHPWQGRPCLNISTRWALSLTGNHQRKLVERGKRKRQASSLSVKHAMIQLFTPSMDAMGGHGGFQEGKIKQKNWNPVQQFKILKFLNYNAKTDVMWTDRIWEDLSGASKLHSTEVKCVANDSGWRNRKDHSWIKSRWPMEYSTIQ